MSIPTEAIEAAARAHLLNVAGINWESATEAVRYIYRTEVDAALTAAAPHIQAAAIAEASAYLERIHPSGLTPTKAVLADLAVVEHRMGRGRHANGNDRITP